MGKRRMCSVCKADPVETDSIFCRACSWWAFNAHWHGKLARERRGLGFVGIAHEPEAIRHPLREAERALTYLRRAINVERGV